MSIDEAIKRYKKHSECIQQTLITKEEAMNVYEWLRELKMYREVVDNKSFEIADPLAPHKHHVLVVKVSDLYDDFFNFEEVNADADSD